MPPHASTVSSVSPSDLDTARDDTLGGGGLSLLLVDGSQHVRSVALAPGDALSTRGRHLWTRSFGEDTLRSVRELASPPRVVGAGSFADIEVRDEANEIVTLLRGHGGVIYSLRLDASASLMVSASRERTIRHGLARRQ